MEIQVIIDMISPKEKLTVMKPKKKKNQYKKISLDYKNKINKPGR